MIKLSKANLSNITGGHFNQLTIADVRAASIFGPGVGGSEDWQRYEDSGEISALITNAKFRGASQRTMVTRNGGVVVYSALSERSCLELIEKINDWIGPYIVNSKD